MYATIRRYEGVDQSRTAELTKKIGDSLAPKLSELPGFASYYAIDAGDGVLTSFGLFESAEQADESGRVAAAWVRDERLESAFPNSPKITSGAVVAHELGAAAVA